MEFAYGNTEKTLVIETRADGSNAIIEPGQVRWEYAVAQNPSPYIPPPPAPPYVPPAVSKMQGILALGKTRWDQVLAYRETATWGEQVVIDSAGNWERDSQNIAFFQYLIGLTDAETDALFIAAAQITA